ncbi:uncharacterized protein LOC135163404 [Diachasmimorpha longicaudata]|uniref:uncharacterized protein LOC135163404 n=1 Tax=Diachasmimorpha longicaudata TaxID=58733 RepID=UPI0030B88D60
MSTFKGNRDVIIILGFIFYLFTSISSAPTTVPSTVTDDSSSQESQETDSSRSARDLNAEMTVPAPTTSSIVLKPNVTGALDVGQGLLVPLVPVVDGKADSQTTQVTPLVANLLPVALESVPEAPDEPKPEIRRSLEDMDVAEDIVFRPLFRYRQEAREKYARNRYYRPYIYAYRNNPRNDYDM